MPPRPDRPRVNRTAIRPSSRASGSGGARNGSPTAPAAGRPASSAERFLTDRTTLREPTAAAGETGPLRLRRQPKWIAAGILAVCLGGLGATFLYAEATTQNSVVVVNRAIARGEQIGVGDLGVVSVGSAPGVSTVSADRVHDLVGQHATTDLSARSLLTEGQIGTPALDAGRATIGLKLAAGRLPAAGLAPGAKVLLVEVLAPEYAGEPKAPVPGTLAGAPQPAADGLHTLVDVQVDPRTAQRVTELAATDRIALYLDAGR
ncbi:SAF domain-containing protein [Granulicoccus phenolivorans]|uniref:SAF domain-containing protein n=1 Tax=Granulicoccus phenolivorans TaxID=266854 RepID=UPI0003FA3296|nr:SAF domain-containing protein [Granulicoccus phenolivorans]